MTYENVTCSGYVETVAEAMLPVKLTIVVVAENVTAENVTVENITTVVENVTAVVGNVTAIAENVTAIAENVTAIPNNVTAIPVDVPMALIVGLVLFAVILFAVIWKTPTPKAKMAMEVATRRSEMMDAMTAFNTGFTQGCNPRKLKTLLENSNDARKRYYEAYDKSTRN
jgi:hypothetical protein